MLMNTHTHTHNLNFELHCMELRFEGNDTVVGLMQEGADVTDVANNLNKGGGGGGGGGGEWREGGVSTLIEN